MGKTGDKNTLRAIPPVDDILGSADLAPLRQAHPKFPWTHCVRGVIDDFRSGKFGTVGDDRDTVRSVILRRILDRVGELRNLGMRRVINCTGVILNTNLGRAVLDPAVRDAVCEAMAHYVNLEVDLESGKRSHRGATMIELLRLATEAEAAMVVNNNAAAVYLVVNSFSPPGRVVVSRGELVEIGGSFRLPDILAKAAGTVVEVGTTNRTYVEDYAKVAKRGDIFLKVHSSNYEIRGFTHTAQIADLVAVAKEKQCHVVYDLGSGSFYDFAHAGIEGEEQVKDVLKTGVDCVTMSGDKLLGGVQAGIIVGRSIFLEQIARNPLRRALRVDKITIAAMQALLRTYLFSDAPERDVPILRQSTEDVETLGTRAQGIVKALSTPVGERFDIAVVDDVAAIGGGSFACQEVTSMAIAIRCHTENEAVALAKKMRERPIPILARIKGSEVRLNLRTVMPYEDEDVRNELENVLGGI
jgi:L-seryl-tRNA(Ser) seleniumtransferase